MTKKKISPPTLSALVRERIGADRLLKLGSQPAAIASGGIDEILHAACAECAAHEQPVISAAVRVIQRAGSRPQPTDLI